MYNCLSSTPLFVLKERKGLKLKIFFYLGNLRLIYVDGFNEMVRCRQFLRQRMWREKLLKEIMLAIVNLLWGS